jgi:transcriptional regulator with XRE-family HTH domain
VGCVAKPSRGEKLKALREERGLTPVALAEKVGVAHNTIARLETEDRRLAQAFGAHPGDLL